MRLYVGQRVECIDAGPCACCGESGKNIKRGAVYTVTQFVGGHVWLLEAAPTNNVIGFAAVRFRPVTEKKTDISIFTRMLTPKRKELVPSVTDDRVRERSAILKQT